MHEDPFSLLQSSGVLFTPIHPITFRSIIQGLQQGKALKHIPYVFASLSREERKRRRVENKTASLASKRATQDCSISWRLNDVWVLTSWEGHPGPEETDFIAEFTDLDSVYEAMYRYYFGSPTLVENWVVPFHQHPEIDKEDTGNAILNAQRVSRVQFEKIQAFSSIQRDKIPPEEQWVSGLPHLFLQIPHKEDANTICYLRRTGKEAYIVEDHPRS